VIKTTFLVTTTKISIIHILSPLDQISTSNVESICSLKWKLKKLLVSHELYQKIYLAPIENISWLVNCLSHSSTQRVCVDLALGNEMLYLWADACKRSQKSVFIRVPSNPNLPQILYPSKWALKGFIDRLAALLLILATSPILIFSTFLILLTSSGPLVSLQWSIGQRGRLFQIIRFRTTIREKESKYFQKNDFSQETLKLQNNPRRTSLGDWMYKYRLDLLPQLINVVKGDMSIVGPKALNLYEATSIKVENRSCLRILPGITGSFSLGKSYYKSHELYNWSLLNDFKFLINFILKLFHRY
jgi:lipopolysaccharide/colanic/teichoic acid biosynthesis glycosyltransferase